MSVTDGGGRFFGMVGDFASVTARVQYIFIFLSDDGRGRRAGIPKIYNIFQNLPPSQPVSYESGKKISHLWEIVRYTII